MNHSDLKSEMKFRQSEQGTIGGPRRSNGGTRIRFNVSGGQQTMGTMSPLFVAKPQFHSGARHGSQALDKVGVLLVPTWSIWPLECHQNNPASSPTI